MPVPSDTPRSADEGALRVLVTGYGPFRSVKVNPSWLAVKPLHNTLIYTNGDSPTPIHITALEVPTTYDAVLSIVPGLHARPPVVPTPKDPAFAVVSPPAEGYDFILHIGVMSSRGVPIRIEQLGHKYGYDQEDAEGEYCVVVGEEDGEGVRGFCKGYEEYPEQLLTPVDCARLIEHLKATGFEHVAPSLDAGRYLCDFINYCSLAESRRTAATGGKSTPALFIHIPGVDHISTDEVTAVLRSTISWVCR
ncbi:peptidase C15, pyroglutamyl peptidase I-like protein [Laetiporus sulphureus 93-53]|uniref:Peptidase C15, pyroglutamyl peptidase I-like protein n=1 Tax=Laetiporus sulphureus 93-53 TaxID=1314785 RepID=A0A165GZT2_9APHY|nr:peptidase C15, pyroglutamyl peptidase I-like protein [Laetiporus sulphureus 93-53]KZT11053.1 peptidase C15, pyroglutamyl peptidase I-like protein [Laetiporus sulphureus 93-53]